jgi:hypothetical protein
VRQRLNLNFKLKAGARVVPTRSIYDPSSRCGLRTIRAP